MEAGVWKSLALQSLGLSFPPTSVHIVAETYWYGTPASTFPSRAAHGLSTSAYLSIWYPGAVGILYLGVVDRSMGDAGVLWRWQSKGEPEGPAEVIQCFPSQVKVQVKWLLCLQFIFSSSCFATSFEIEFTFHVIHPSV